MRLFKSIFKIMSILPFMLVSCQRQMTSEVSGATDTIQFRYARLISIVRNNDIYVATIKNPWDTTQILHRYCLRQRGDTVASPLQVRSNSVPTPLPQATQITVPLRNVVISSAVYCALWKELGAEASVKGICDTQYLMSKYWRDALSGKSVRDMGSSLNVDVERLMSVHCDAILMSPFNKATYGAIEKTEIPIIECADYMETSPLARAEWMRFYGLLSGRQREADSLFRCTEAAYMALKNKVAQTSVRPTVFMDLMYSGTWYQPGANSTTGRMIADAGGQYVFADYVQSGSVPLSFESVFKKAHDAQFWFVRSNEPEGMTYSLMKRLNEKYSFFDAWKKRRIWLCNLSREAFFEEVPFHPERLLRDYITILHPELIQGQRSTTYYKAMQ